jgi:hypothetical protein
MPPRLRVDEVGRDKRVACPRVVLRSHILSVSVDKGGRKGKRGLTCPAPSRAPVAVGSERGRKRGRDQGGSKERGCAPKGERKGINELLHALFALVCTLFTMHK